MSSNEKGNNSKSGNSPDNDSGMPIQQVIQMGEAAANLLENPIYNLAHRMAVNEAVEAWSQTQPKEREKRESLWAEVQALGRTAQTLGVMVERAKELVQKQAEQDFNKEQEYMDQQGFGLGNEYAGGDRSFQ